MADDVPFASAEAFYAEYRPGYGEAAIEYLVDRFALDEAAGVLDLGCGAGQLTVPLADRVGRVVAVDPNETMLGYAEQRARDAGVENVEWRVGSDADLDTEIGPFRLTTMGRSFHWMDERDTIDTLYAVTEPGGGVAILNDREWLTKGRADWTAAVYETVAAYVEDLPERENPEDVEYGDPWDELLESSQFADVETRTFEVEREWTVDEIVGYVFSLSFCAPRVLGETKADVEAAVRKRLGEFDRDVFGQTAAVEVLSARCVPGE